MPNIHTHTHYFFKDMLRVQPDIEPPSLSADESLCTQIHSYVVFRFIAAPRYVDTNCGEQTVALYRDVTPCVLTEEAAG